jgi:hypothetical protein
MGTAQSIPTGQQAWNEEIVVNALVGNMAYTRTEAREMFSHAAPKLRADMPLEEVISLTLQEGGKEG